MPAYLLDSSAVLALFGGEPGAEVVQPLLGEAAIHSVQIAEVVKKLADRGVPANEAERAVTALGLPVVESFRAEEAVYSRRNCQKGISLGDRICLTVADRAGMTAVTAEHRWKEMVEADASLPVKVLLIHSREH
jgi:ribonuclease VapC